MRDQDKYFYDDEFYNSEILRIWGPTYAGREIIQKDMDVRQRIFRTRSPEDKSILVDTEQNPEIYIDYLNEAVDRARDDHDRFRRFKVPQAVFETVQSRMKYSAAGVQEILARPENRHKVTVGLSIFADEGVGKCLQQALMCAMMLETFRNGGLIHGQVSVDSSLRLHMDGNVNNIGGHAWARLESPDGQVIVLDVAQNRFGPLEECM